jgi:hypothetical protein
MRHVCSGDVLIGVLTVQQPLDDHVVVHSALQDPASVQLDEAVDKHLCGGIQAALEWPRSTDAFDEITRPIEDSRF